MQVSELGKMAVPHLNPKFYFHALSNSLPSIAHLVISQFLKLHLLLHHQWWKNYMTFEVAITALESCFFCRLLNKPWQRSSMSQINKQLDEYLRFLDAYGKAKDALFAKKGINTRNSIKSMKKKEKWNWNCK